MTLAFIIPLRSQQTTNNWPLVCRLLERTVRSCRQQIDPDFEVVIVGHERPEMLIIDDRVAFIEARFPPPGEDINRRFRDQFQKLTLGIKDVRARNSAAMVMPLDADDLVSNLLTAFANEHADSSGFFFNSGYEFEQDTARLIYRRRGMHLRTGSSHILNLNLLHALLNEASIEDPFTTPLYHLNTVEWFARTGTPLVELPFPGVVYVTDHGENLWWGRQQIAARARSTSSIAYLRFLAGRLYRSMRASSVDPAIQNEFGLTELPINSPQFNERPNVV